MMFRSYPDVMTVKQLAAALGIGINKAYEIVNDGTINSREDRPQDSDSEALPC